MSLENLLQNLLHAILDEPKPPRQSRPQQRNHSRKPQSSSSRKLSGTVSRSQQIYGEQSIFMNAAQKQMQIPFQLRQMRTLSGIGMNGTRSMESLFVQQGRFMADYTDDFPYFIPCTRRIPMYYNLSNDELRCYFTWRTQYRQDGLPATESPYLLLYCSEIINQIGVSSPAEGYEKLLKLSDDYAVLCPDIVKRIARWLPDYAAYYRLPYQSTDAKDAALTVILRHTLHQPEQLIEAFNTLSKYHILNSKLYAAYPTETACAVKTAYQQLLLYYAQQKGESLAVFYFGGRRRSAHTMFEGAVFYEPERDLVREAYRLNPVYTYHCYHGQWAVEQYCGDPDGARIGAFLRTVDSLLREILGFKGKLKPGELPEGDADVIRRAILGYLEAKRQSERPKIELNAKELAAIRAAAEHTTDMLTLPEEEPEQYIPDAALPVSTEKAPEHEPETETPAAAPDLPLSKPALTLLLCLLTGESYQPLVDAGQMISVLTDEINEALYEQFGDTVLETDDSGAPVLVDDYTDELKELCSGTNL